MRNIIAHEYQAIDYHILWNALTTRLPVDAAAIRTMLSPTNPSPQRNPTDRPPSNNRGPAHAPAQRPEGSLISRRSGSQPPNRTPQLTAAPSRSRPSAVHPERRITAPIAAHASRPRNPHVRTRTGRCGNLGFLTIGPSAVSPARRTPRRDAVRAVAPAGSSQDRPSDPQPLAIRVSRGRRRDSPSACTKMTRIRAPKTIVPKAELRALLVCEITTQKPPAMFSSDTIVTMIRATLLPLDRPRATNRTGPKCSLT